MRNGYANDIYDSLFFGGNPFKWVNNLKSLTTDGINERLLTPNDVLDITGAFSVSWWFKTTSTASLNCHVSKDTTGGVSRSWNMSFRGVSLRYLYCVFWNTDGSFNQLTSTPNVYDDGTWHNAIFTYDGTAAANGAKLYVDGSLDSQITATSTGVQNYTGANSGISLGATSGSMPGWFNNGQLDEVAIWDGTVLSSVQASAIYNSGVPTDLNSYSPTMWWRCGDFYTWDGVDLTLPEVMGTGADMVSENMEEVDITTDVPV